MTEMLFLKQNRYYRRQVTKVVRLAAEFIREHVPPNLRIFKWSTTAHN